MYSLYDYGWMIASTERTNAYIEALRRAVKPGSVVVDVGTGTGFWALLACQFGARKVYAIEAGDVIDIARETAHVNGFSDRIEFIQDLSTRVSLPAQADVMVSDIRGVLPVFGICLQAIMDARRRFLSPQGVIIPLRDSLWASLVDSPKLHASFTNPWDKDNHGCDMRKIRQRVMNTWKKENVVAQSLVTEPQCWAVLDYSTLDTYDVAGNLNWTIAEDRVAHGVSMWFDSTLMEGFTFSNAPGVADLIYGRAFFPWPEPVSLQVGDTVSISVQAKSVGADYVWSWDTNVVGPGRKNVEFHQSTFYAAMLSPGRLRKLLPDFQPLLTEDAEIERFVLERMDGQTSVVNISQQLQRRFPGSFPTFEEAKSRVSDLCLRCSR